jgi:hypothetical protein
VRHLLAGALFGLVALCGVVWATDLPVSLKHCRTRAYPKVIYSGDTLDPGVAPDTYEVYTGQSIVLRAIMGVDDSSGADPQYRCNCDTIEALWDSSNCGNFFYRFRVRLWREQPDRPEWTLESAHDSLRNIDTLAALGNGGGIDPGECTDLVACPWTFTFPAVNFNREGVGYLKVQGRVQNYNNDYLAPAGDTCKVYFRISQEPPEVTGTRVMVAR